ncbi:hypothetical protein DBR11_25885, partial [Pedobacter sp. HMWF019]
MLSVDCIKQPVDDEILELSMKETLKTFSDHSDSFDINFNDSFAHIGRLKEVSNKIEQYNVWSDENRKKIRRILAIVSEIANHLNIPLILHGGTLLGYVQHGEIIPWDDDVDLGIKEIDLVRFQDAITIDKRLSFASKVEERTGVVFYKIWSQDGEAIENFSYKFPFVDLWLYNIKNEDIVFKNYIVFPQA